MLKKFIIFISITIILVFLYKGTSFYFNSDNKTELQDANNSFFIALSEANIDKAKEYAAGEILFKLHNVNTLPEAKVLKSETKIINYNKNFANVFTKLELKLKNGDIDVNWYEVNLIYKQDSWRVFSLKEVLPPINYSISNKEIPEATIVFEEYINFLQKEQYSKANSLLIGQIKKIDSTSVDKLPIGEINNILHTPLYGNSEFQVYEIKYNLNNNVVEILVSFHKTSDGWKIYSINSSTLGKES